MFFSNISTVTLLNLRSVLGTVLKTSIEVTVCRWTLAHETKSTQKHGNEEIFFTERTIYRSLDLWLMYC